MGCVQPELKSLKLPLGNNAREEEVTEEEVLAEMVPISNSNMESRGSQSLGDDTSLEHVEPHWPAVQVTTIPRLASHSTEEQALALFDKLKEEHDIAKAVKSDNAKVPVHLWDEGVVGWEPTEQEKEALTMMRLFCLHVYRKGLLRDVRAHLVSKF
jgi:hypothetical protein